MIIDFAAFPFETRWKLIKEGISRHSQAIKNKTQILRNVNNLDDLDLSEDAEFPKEFEQQIIDLAMFVAIARSPLAITSFRTPILRSASSSIHQACW